MLTDGQRLLTLRKVNIRQGNTLRVARAAPLLNASPTTPTTRPCAARRLGHLRRRSATVVEPSRYAGAAAPLVPPSATVTLAGAACVAVISATVAILRHFVYCFAGCRTLQQSTFPCLSRVLELCTSTVSRV